MKTDPDMKEFLDEKVLQYNNPAFIEHDPIQIPHRYTLKEDIEISGFLTAVIAWGNRKSIIRNAQKIVNLMGNAPYDFVMSYKQEDMDRLRNFVHRTFNATDLEYFIKGLRHIYEKQDGLEGCFRKYGNDDSLQPAIHHFKQEFFSMEHPARSEKHLPDPLKGSAAKRLNMFLRWMVRKDRAGVDFGVWESISPSVLSCPLDVHTGNIARKLGLLKRKQNDAKAVSELDSILRHLDPLDPVKYDFALFGLGAFEGF